MVMALVMPDPMAPSFTALINVLLRNGSADGRCGMRTGIGIGFEPYSLPFLLPFAAIKVQKSSIRLPMRWR